MTKVSRLLPLTDAMGLFKAFAEPVRIRLLALLADGREVCVCHLHERWTCRNRRCLATFHFSEQADGSLPENRGGGPTTS